MIVRFGVENYKSIKDYQEISFVASSLKEESKTVDLINTPKEKVKLLPSILIYGANASGKSSFYEAMSNLVRYVTESQNYQNLPYYQPHKNNSLDTRYLIEILIDKIKYEYEVTYNFTGFTREILHYYPKGKPRLAYKRIGDDFELGDDFNNKNMHDLKDVILKKKMMLFLSLAHFHSDIFSKLHTTLKIQAPNNNNINVFTFREPKVDGRIIEFLKHIDSGITGNIFVETNIGTQTGYEIQFTHGLNKTLPLNFRSESQGSKHLFKYLPSYFLAIDEGDIQCIDEIETSLHPSVVDKILELFANNAVNTKGAQLLATTHNPLLLNSDFIRRDQIYFTEKNEQGETTIYPLKDFATRANGDFTKAYLAGHFGAIPYIGDIVGALAHEK